jgi:hypothetical protein
VEELPDDTGIVLRTLMAIRADTREILRLIREDEDEEEAQEDEP